MDKKYFIDFNKLLEYIKVNAPCSIRTVHQYLESEFGVVTFCSRSKFITRLVKTRAITRVGRTIHYVGGENE